MRQIERVSQRMVPAIQAAPTWVGDLMVGAGAAMLVIFVLHFWG